jgi:hypothetical protein
MASLHSLSIKGVDGNERRRREGTEKAPKYTSALAAWPPMMNLRYRSPALPINKGRLPIKKVKLPIKKGQAAERVILERIPPFSNHYPPLLAI